MMLFGGTDAPFSQDTIQESIKTGFSERVEDNLLDLYNSTLNEYGDGQNNILSPCDLADSFDSISGISTCDTVDDFKD